MSISIFCLILLSIVSGFLFSDMFIGYGTIFEIIQFMFL
jgi:hypothetical protein